MRKNQVLVVAVALLFCSAVAVQAQQAGVYEIYSNAVTARTGGAAELSGNVVVFLRTGNHAGGEVTLKYSASLAKGTVPMVTPNNATAVTDEDEDTVVITMPNSGDDIVTLSDVRLDLRDAEAPVTITASGNATAFVSGVSAVISGIQDALTVTSKSAQILTRGGMGSATVTLKEAFATAFTAGADVKLTLVGVPDKASLTVSHAGHPTEAALDADPTLNDADVAGAVTLNGADGAMIVDNAETTGMELAMTGDGDKLNITVGFTAPNAASTESVKLMFDLAATSAQEDLMLPIAERVVEVWVTMAPDEAAETPDGTTEDEYFAVNYLPADGVVAFTFNPATCTLLFPYVVSLPDFGWNTGLAITNPTAGSGSPLAGAITFTLYANGAEMPMTVTTGAMTAGALNDEGMLEAGNTYTVLLTELLAMAEPAHAGDFTGHLYAKTDFTGCRGVGWVTDFGTVNQAYLPYFEDNRDLGSVPGNNVGSMP